MNYSNLWEHYIHALLPAYQGYADASAKNVGKFDLRGPASLATKTLYSFRQILEDYLPKSELTPKFLGPQIRDFDILARVENLSKHNSKDVDNILMNDNSQILETATIHTYYVPEPVEAYMWVHMRIMIQTNFGEWRDLLDVCTNVVNGWNDYLHSKRLISREYLTYFNYSGFDFLTQKQVSERPEPDISWEVRNGKKSIFFLPFVYGSKNDDLKISAFGQYFDNVIYIDRRAGTSSSQQDHNHKKGKGKLLVDTDPHLHLFNIIIPAYNKYVELTHQKDLKESMLLKAALQTASLLYRFREILESSLPLDKLRYNDIIKVCPDYEWISDVINVFENSSSNNVDKIIQNRTAIEETIVQTFFYREGTINPRGFYSIYQFQVLITPILGKGSIRNLLQVTTNVLNFWAKFLVENNILNEVINFRYTEDDIIPKEMIPAENSSATIPARSDGSVQMAIVARYLEPKTGKFERLKLEDGKLSFIRVDERATNAKMYFYIPNKQSL